ncbi:MAG: NAD(P)-dependent alcohol dehydrogenase [Candidatus Hydrogenedentes bacterium]|nr:NAD(P)-dependent alcohol dehydrogenase [Candidatus Hydrogenedentota bacterium]
MRIWRFHEHGDIANLQLEDVPIPTPRVGEALVRIAYAALNPADALVVRGLYPRAGAPPMAVGRDGAGVIEKASVDGRYKTGDRVIVLRGEVGVTRDGTLAECCVVPETLLTPLPVGWTMQQGAAGPLVFLTAWRALVDTGGLQPGQTVFVNGASGGVGSATVMLARALGARVIAGSRSADKRARLTTLGAVVTVDSTNPDAMESEILRVLDGGRVDIVVENLGGAYLQSSVNVLAENGRIGVVGLLGGFMAEISLGHLIFKRARIEGVAVGAYTAGQAQDAWTKILAASQKTGAKPIIDSEFAFDDVHAAFNRLAEGPMGKVIVRTA